MNSILWAVIPIALLGLILWITTFFARKGQLPAEEIEEPTRQASAGGCCGQHQTCERDSLLSAVSERIVYYDDEELDRYKGIAGSDYDDPAIEEFRSVLVTLREDDVAGWVRSLQLREIMIPEELLPEVFMVVGENRAYHMAHGPGKHDH